MTGSFTRLLACAAALVLVAVSTPGRVLAQDVETIVIQDSKPLLETGLRLADQTVLAPQPVPGRTTPQVPDLPTSHGNIDYKGLLADSFVMATIQHTFRIATEYRTREALKGPFWEDYAHALTIWRGWDDGDTIRVNYLGHPAMGSFSAFIFENNDLVSQSTSFGQPGYGRAKWRQFLFANVYSLQFELGPYSEASIGNVDQAVIDHIMTPVVGLGWSCVEDYVDAKWISKLRRNHGKLAKLVATFATPTHSLANIAAFKAPWYRARPIVD
jgi:hypothetical protein